MFLVPLALISTITLRRAFSIRVASGLHRSRPTSDLVSSPPCLRDADKSSEG